MSEVPAVDQFKQVRTIRALASHYLTEADGTFACSCGYGLGDGSGNLRGRYEDHLNNVTDRRAS